MSDRTLLVTGGCGFIGANLVRAALADPDGPAVVNLDALTYAGCRASLADVEGDARYEFVHGDVCDERVVRERVARCDVVIHLAAESHVDRSIMDARPFVETNVLGTQTIVDAILAADRPVRLVHVSTDEVYGPLPLDDPDAAFDTDARLRPTSPYAASKAAADLLVQSAVRTFGLDACITRSTNNLGPFQHPEKLIPLFITNLLRGEKVPVYGDGLHERDWLHVDDHVAGLLAAAQRGRRGAIYHFASGQTRSNLDLTRTLLRLLGKGESMIEHVADRPSHDRRYAIDTASTEAGLGWRAKRPIDDATLAEVVDWYREHEAWWRPIRDGDFATYYARQYRS